MKAITGRFKNGKFEVLWSGNENTVVESPEEGVLEIKWGVQEPPENKMIYNRKQKDGSYRDIGNFFDGNCLMK